jgi:dienelactone hydrolase
VDSGIFDVAGGYTCGGSGTLAYYPAGNFTGDEGTFPVVIYAHGMEGFAMENLITAVKNVASFGFVVLAPNTSGTANGCSSKREWKDLVLVAQQEKTVNAFFQYVGNNVTANFSKLAVWGRSMGGKTVADALAQERRPFTAAILQNGGRKSHQIRTPSMYLTATKDTSSSPPEIMRQQFIGNRAHNKVFVNVRGGYHILPPDEEAQMNTWMASFLHCHLSERWEDCAKIYDKGSGTICTEPLLAQCNVSSRNGSVPMGPVDAAADPHLAGDALPTNAQSAASIFLA